MLSKWRELTLREKNALFVALFVAPVLGILSMPMVGIGLLAFPFLPLTTLIIADRRPVLYCTLACCAYMVGFVGILAHELHHWSVFEMVIWCLGMGMWVVPIALIEALIVLRIRRWQDNR